MVCIYQTTLKDNTVLYVYRESVNQYYVIWVTNNGFGFKAYSNRSYIRKFLKNQFGIIAELQSL